MEDLIGITGRSVVNGIGALAVGALIGFLLGDGWPTAIGLALISLLLSAGGQWFRGELDEREGRRLLEAAEADEGAETSGAGTPAQARERSGTSRSVPKRPV